MPASKNVRELPVKKEQPPADTIAVVPPQEFLDTYVSRKIAGVSDLEMLKYAHENTVNVLIEGPTGAGKTSAVMAYAVQNQLPFYATPSSIGLEPSQLFGRFVPTEDKGLRWQDGPVTHLVRHGGVLLINEINFIPERVSTVLFSLLDKRRTIQLLDHHGEVIRAHPKLLIVADMNPEYRGTRPLNAALRNRFDVQQHWDYDPEVEKQLVSQEAVLRLAKKLRGSTEIITPVSTNMLVAFVSQAQFNWDFAVQNFIGRFIADERPHISPVIDLLAADIKKDLFNEVPKRATIKDDTKEWDPDDYDLTVKGTADNPNPLNHPDWEPSMGIYGEDWNLSVDDEDED